MADRWTEGDRWGRDYSGGYRGAGYGQGRYEGRYGREGYGSSNRWGEYGRGTGGGDYANRGYYRNEGYGRGDYGGYGRQDWGRDDNRDYNRDFGRDYNRDYGRGYRDDRGWMDRAGDEVASWFGDEDAERRRRMDDLRDRDDWRDYGARSRWRDDW